MIKRLIRLYLIGRAPAEPQEWFKATLPQRPTSFIPRPKDWSDGQKRLYEGLHEGYLDTELVTDESVLEHFAATNAARKATTEWGAEAARLRYVQWPAAWADAVISASNNTPFINQKKA